MAQTPNKESGGQPTDYRNPVHGSSPRTKHRGTKTTACRYTADQRRFETTKNPPIVLRQREIWSALLQHMRTLTIKFREAKSVYLGIQILPERIEDYRAIVAHLDKKRWAYHTFQLPEEKTLHVVLRGIPIGVSNEEVRDDLEGQGLHPTKILLTAMRNGEKVPIQLVVIQVPRDEKRVYDIQLTSYES